MTEEFKKDNIKQNIKPLQLLEINKYRIIHLTLHEFSHSIQVSNWLSLHKYLKLKTKREMTRKNKSTMHAYETLDHILT
jgi:hypothetical protein